MHNPIVTYPSIFGIEQTPGHWQAAFNEATDHLPEGVRAAFAPLWEKTANLSFPTIKHEKWRWLDFSGMGLGEAKLQTQPQLNLTIEHLPAGEDDPEQPMALPDGMVISRFGDALRNYPELASRLLSGITGSASDKLQAAAEALGRDGLFVYVPRSVRVSGVVVAHLWAQLEPCLTLTRSLIWLDAGSELNLVLDLQGGSAGKMLGVSHLGKTDLIIGDGARLNITDVSAFTEEVINLSYSQARLERDAKLEWVYCATAGVLGKQSLAVNLVGEGAEAEVGGAYFPSEGQRISVDTVQNHLAPHTRSNLLFRGAAIGNGEAIWRGMVYVDPIAQRTDGYQANQNLMLGERSEVKSIPGLEICADDVSCSHGATVGRIDENELFYLAARGLPPVEAERLIVEGFFDEIFERVPDEKTRNWLHERLLRKFDVN